MEGKNEMSKAEKWPRSILYHMPSKIEGKRNDEIEPVNNENPSLAKDTSVANPEGNRIELTTDKQRKKEQ
jgi:hypothetical protein